MEVISKMSKNYRSRRRSILQENNKIINETRSSSSSLSLSMSMLPIEIVSDEILPKLSARYLTQLKCVNKFFRTLISSPKFIDLHLRHCHSSKTNPFLILTKAPGLHTLYWVDLDSPLALVTRLPGPKAKVTCFVGHCNGLVCFTTRTTPTTTTNKLFKQHKLVFSNPCTRVYKSGILVPFTCLVCYGFGYDSINDDYKVVAYGNCFTDDDDDYIDHNEAYRIIEVKVYSTRANAWRCIEKSYTKDYGLTQAGALVDNHLIHWVFKTVAYDTTQHRIRCFNLETENWTDDVPVPEFDKYDYLRTINGCLGLFTRDEVCTYLWIMKEYGVKESWVKVLVSEIRPERYSLHYKNYDGCLLDTMVSAYRRETGKDELLVMFWKIYRWYNVNTVTYDKFKQIPPVGFRIVASSIGSLVSID